MQYRSLLWCLLVLHLSYIIQITFFIATAQSQESVVSSSSSLASTSPTPSTTDINLAPSPSAQLAPALLPTTTSSDVTKVKLVTEALPESHFNSNFNPISSSLFPSVLPFDDPSSTLSTPSTESQSQTDPSFSSSPIVERASTPAAASEKKTTEKKKRKGKWMKRAQVKLDE